MFDARRKDEKNACRIFYSENLKERDLLDELGIDDCIVLKLLTDICLWKIVCYIHVAQG